MGSQPPSALRGLFHRRSSPPQADGGGGQQERPPLAALQAPPGSWGQAALCGTDSDAAAAPGVVPWAQAGGPSSSAARSAAAHGGAPAPTWPPKQAMQQHPGVQQTGPRQAHRQQPQAAAFRVLAGHPPQAPSGGGRPAAAAATTQPSQLPSAPPWYRLQQAQPPSQRQQQQPSQQPAGQSIRQPATAYQQPGMQSQVQQPHQHPPLQKVAPLPWYPQPAGQSYACGPALHAEQQVPRAAAPGSVPGSCGQHVGVMPPPPPRQQQLQQPAVPRQLACNVQELVQDVRQGPPPGSQQQVPAQQQPLRRALPPGLQQQQPPPQQPMQYGPPPAAQQQPWAQQPVQQPQPQPGMQPGPPPGPEQQPRLQLPQVQPVRTQVAEQRQAAPPPPAQQQAHVPGAGPAHVAAAGPVRQQPAPKQPLRFTLGEWGLPPGVVQAYEAKGVKRMYPWQAAALECGEAYNNLVYCAPTSGGKSLVAEVLMVRRLVRSTLDIPQPRRSKPKYGRALVVLPYVSIVNEKSAHLEAVLRPMHASVKGFCGGAEEGAAVQPLAPRGETVALCTIEKANVAINRLAQEGRLGELCCVVVDELHMVSDTDRGIGLEMSLSKLMFSPAAQHIQIIGMSATMGGLEALRAWLRAELFLTNFRPVPLTEHAVFRGRVYEKIGPQELAALRKEQEDAPPLRELREVAPSESRRDADRLVPLVAEATSEGHSVLVFCSSRKQCESAAALIADLLPQIAPPPPEKQAELAELRQGIIADIKIAMGGAMSAELEACMLQGIAWHHAGLTSEERAGVERAYCAGAIQVVTATSTLAAGVNMPARRVILRSLHQGIGPVSRSQYLQMVGRAGRAGHAAAGESFLIGKGAAGGQEWHQVCGLLTAPIPELQSRVLCPAAAALFASKPGEVNEEATRHLQQLLLEGIANGSVREAPDVARLVCSTFAAHQQGLDMMRQASKAALRELLNEKRLVQWAPGQAGQLELTHKGRAVYDSALPLEPAMRLYDSCSRAEDGFMLDRPLVLLYSCLLQHPFQIESWAAWGKVLKALDKADQEIAASVGVELKHALLAQGGRPLPTDLQERHGRLAAALALSELTQERDIQGVVAKWGREGFVSKGLSRGQIQKMQQDAGKWMGMASLLCESAGWWPLAMLYSNLSQMAAAGVRQDLLPLMRIPDMDAGKARALFKAGLRDTHALATADEEAVAKALVPAIAQQMRTRSSVGKQQGGTSAAIAANYAAVSMSARAASTLVLAAREHLRRQVADLAALAADIQEDEVAAAAGAAPGGQQQAQQGAAGGGGLGATDDLSAAELAHIQREVAQAGAAAGTPEQLAAAEVSIAPAAALQWTAGWVRVTELRPRSTASQLAEFLEQWAAQPRYALALHILSADELAAATATAGGIGSLTVSVGGKLVQQGSVGSGGEAAGVAAAGERRQRLQGIAVCWDLQQAFFLELSGAHCARELQQGGSATLLDAVRAVLAKATAKVCYHATEALPELLQLGIRLGGQLEDPRTAAALLWPDAAADDPTKLSLKRIQASAAPRYKARVPNLCRSGVTDTTRVALTALAVMEPLTQMLGHRRMLEAYSLLEMPAQLALLHMNASPAAPRLCPAQLAAAKEAAAASAAVAEEQLRRIYGMPRLDLSSGDTVLQLLGSLRMPVPERDGRRRGPPTVTLDHLQQLLAGCRPHQRREQEALALMVQHKALSQLVAAPVQALLDLATGQSAAAAVGSRPNSASVSGSASGSAGPSSGGSAGAPAQAQQQQQEQPQGGAMHLLLEACAATGALSYGAQLDRQLASLLAAEWCPFLVGGTNQSVQAELAAGSLTPEAVAAAASQGSGRGLPVALCVPRRQLVAAASAASGTAAPGSSDPFEEGPPEEEAEVWVLGQLQQVLGKRLRTALDFGAEQHSMHSSRDHSSSGSQRASMAVVWVAVPPNREQARLHSAAFGASWAATPSSISLTWPCDQLWRLDPGLSAALCGSAGAGGVSSAGVGAAQHQQQQQVEPGGAPGAAAAAGLGPPLPAEVVSWGVSAYCSGAAVFAAAGVALPTTAGAGGDAGLPHKGQQQRQEQQQGAAAGLERPLTGGSCAGLLLRVELRYVELAVLAALSGEPELAAALRRCSAASNASSSSPRDGGGGSGGGSRDAYEYLSNVWAAAAGQLHVPGTELLISGATAAAVAQALLHHWSAKKLGWVLQAPRQVAAAALDSFLAAFPRLGAWLAEAAAAAEAGKGAATLAGRQRALGVPKRADDAMARGKLHKAALQFALEGSAIDLLKAALASTAAALASLDARAGSSGGRSGPAQIAAGRLQAQQQPEWPEVVLVLGHSLVVHLPGQYITGAHGGDGGAAAAAVAGAVQGALGRMRVGRAQLAAPPAAVFTAGRTLHLLDQVLVAPTAGPQQ